MDVIICYFGFLFIMLTFFIWRREMMDTEKLTATTVRRLSRLEPEVQMVAGINPARLSCITAHCPHQERNHFNIGWSHDYSSTRIYGHVVIYVIWFLRGISFTSRPVNFRQFLSTIHNAQNSSTVQTLNKMSFL